LFSSILLTEHISTRGTSVFRESQFMETLTERLATLILSAFDGSEWLPSRSDPFTPGKEPLHQSKGRPGGPQNQSGCCGEENTLVPTWIRTPDHPVRSTVTIPTTPVPTKY